MRFGLDHSGNSLRDERAQTTEGEVVQIASQNAWRHTMHFKISAWLKTTKYSHHTAQSQRHEQLWEKFLRARNLEYVEFMIQVFCIA